MYVYMYIYMYIYIYIYIYVHIYILNNLLSTVNFYVTNVFVLMMKLFSMMLQNFLSTF